jgi:peptide/nickel transport system substrate-binding protein
MLLNHTGGKIMTHAHRRVIVAGLLIILTAIAGPALGQSQAPRVLRIATDTNLPWLDPHVGPQFALREIATHVFETVVTVGADHGVIPQLASAWTVSPEGLHYTFTLRSGVRFHNGKILNAEDVKASLERYLQVGVRRADLGGIQTVTVVDPLTVRVSLKEPQGSFLGVLAVPLGMIAIMPKEIAERSREPLTPPNLIGTGPFQLVEWQRDRQITLRRFPDYSRDARPASGLGGERRAMVDEIHVISILESGTRLAALERGDVDYAIALPPTSYERLVNSSTLRPVVIKPFVQVVVQMNASRPPFNNVKARQAVSRGLDMEAIMRAVTVNQPAFYRLQPSIFFPEQQVWHNMEGRTVYNSKNLDLAKRLLQESGYDGRTITFVTIRDIEYMYRAALTVKPQLEAIGFKVDLAIRDVPGQIALQRDWNFDMATNGMTTRTDPTAYNYLLQCGASWETYGYCDNDMDKWLVVGLRIRDPERRAHAYAQAQRAFYDTVPFVKIGDFHSMDGANQALKGYQVFFQRRFWNVSK